MDFIPLPMKLDGKGAVIEEGWQSHVSTDPNKKNRIKPIGHKVIKKDASGCDAVGVVTGDGHITIVDGKAVFHFPVSTRSKWNPTNDTTCEILVPDAKEKGKKRPAPSSPSPSSGAKKRATSSIVQDVPTHNPPSSSSAPPKRKADDDATDPDTDEEIPITPKRAKDDKCDCSGCKNKDSKYVYYVV